MLSSIIPTIIKNFINKDDYCKIHGQVFEVILNKLLTSGVLKDDSTKEFVVE